MLSYSKTQKQVINGNKYDIGRLYYKGSGNMFILLKISNSYIGPILLVHILCIKGITK